LNHPQIRRLVSRKKGQDPFTLGFLRAQAFQLKQQGLPNLAEVPPEELGAIITQMTEGAVQEIPKLTDTPGGAKGQEDHIMNQLKNDYERLKPLLDLIIGCLERADDERIRELANPHDGVGGKIGVASSLLKNKPELDPIVGFLNDWVPMLNIFRKHTAHFEELGDPRPGGAQVRVCRVTKRVTSPQEAGSLVLTLEELRHLSEESFQLQFWIKLAIAKTFFSPQHWWDYCVRLRSDEEVGPGADEFNSLNQN
jgi:hypothetical protein